MEGIAMGGSLAGPYGAGGGLIIGLITGLITADSHYGQINNQISTEQKKDQQLEAAIEQELARQRGLENQISKAGDGSATTEATETSGVTRHIRLTTLEPNASVDRATFAFTPPKGVKIVDQTSP